MSVVTAKVAVTNYLIGEHPEQTRPELIVIEKTRRRALGEPTTVKHRALPGPVDLPTLAAEVARAGAEADLDIDVGEVPEAIGASVYWIVHEALTDVAAEDAHPVP